MRGGGAEKLVRKFSAGQCLKKRVAFFLGSIGPFWANGRAKNNDLRRSERGITPVAQNPDHLCKPTIGKFLQREKAGLRRATPKKKWPPAAGVNKIADGGSSAPAVRVAPTQQPLQEGRAIGNKNAKPERVSSGPPPWWAGLFALPFAGVGVFMGWRVVTMLWLAAAAQAWVETPATLTRLALEQGDTQEVVAEYRYRFGGNEHRGERVGLATGSDNLGSYHKRLYST